MKKLVIAALAGSVMLGSQFAVAADADEAIEYREGVFHALKWHFGPMAGMVKGKMEYNQESFQHHADMVAALSKMVDEGFADGTQGGDAKDLIWEQRADFTKHVEALETSSAALQEAAAGGDMDAIKPAFAAVAKSCKGCHDNYRD